MTYTCRTCSHFYGSFLRTIESLLAREAFSRSIIGHVRSKIAGRLAGGPRLGEITWFSHGLVRSSGPTCTVVSWTTRSSGFCRMMRKIEYRWNVTFIWYFYKLMNNRNCLRNYKQWNKSRRWSWLEWYSNHWPPLDSFVYFPLCNTV